MTTLPTCQCHASQVAYTVTAADLPELTPAEAEAFIDYPVYAECTANVNKGRTFAPGHDAKLKSALIKAFRAGTDFSYLDGSLLVHADPVAVADDRGWGHFMTAAPKRKSRKGSLQGKGSAAAKAAHGQAESDSDQPVVGFRPCQVKVGRWWKDGQVVAYPSDGQVTVTYKDSKGEPKTITVDTDKVKEG
jgi:hypothetical protein